MSTRPSHDNVINTLGVNMASALDQIMTVQEESYDDFLEGFTYLNKGKNLSTSHTQIQITKWMENWEMCVNYLRWTEKRDDHSNKKENRKTTDKRIQRNRSKRSMFGKNSDWKSG